MEEQKVKKYSSWNDVTSFLVKSDKCYSVMNECEKFRFIDELISEDLKDDGKRYDFIKYYLKPMKEDSSQIYDKIGVDFFTNQPKYKIRKI